MSSSILEGMVGAEEKVTMNEKNLQKVDSWILKEVGEDGTIEDYEEISERRCNVWTIDGEGRTVVFKVEVIKGKVTLIGKEIINE